MNAKKRVVIAGGGTAGWVVAAALSKKLGSVLDITLVESDEISTVGVGEATIPPMQVFHSLLGIDQQEFMRATSATFKLGISFENWGQQDDNYFHSFGKTGQESYLAEFQHFWLRGLKEGISSDFADYSLETQAAQSAKFSTSESKLNFAYHLDATAYAQYLRTLSEKWGVKRVEGKIVKVSKHNNNGFIDALTLNSGQQITGDFFIDCTGFRGLLIEKTLHTGYEDWSHWLPCDSAIAVQTKSTGEMLPYTRSIAHDTGWRWRIPLQHRVGNGLVYCSQYLSDEQANTQLLEDIEGETLTEPRVIKFKTGKRRKAWNKNCVAFGLSGGFVEPLESTSIHLIMTGIVRLMRLFPLGEVHQSSIDEYNMQTNTEIEHIRDFIILHYHATQRDDSPFWNYCKNMDIPDTLAHRIELFKRNGHAFQRDGELFRVDSWTQVMLGQGVMPEQYHPIADTMSHKQLPAFLNSLKTSITREVDKLPSHHDFITQYCKMDVK